MKNLIAVYLVVLVTNINAQEKDTIVLIQNLKVASKAQFICEWGDSEYMELHTNKKIYRFKRGLEDGKYIAVFDKNINWKKPLKDTAMVAVIQDGELNGLLIRWDDEDKDLAEECEYKSGLMDGYRKLYFFDEEGNKYTNIELYEKGLPVKTIRMEW